MKTEDEKYFSEKMNELADKFNTITQEPVAGCCPPGNKCVVIDAKAAEELNELSQRVYSEFKNAGYNDDDWTSLMQRSGAGPRMGLGS